MRRLLAFLTLALFVAIPACEGRPGGLTGVTPLNLPPVKLVILSQPTDEAVATNITPVVQVAIQDVSGKTTTQAAANVSVSITTGTGTSGAILTGTTINNQTAAGIAVFSDLQIDRAGTGYTLTFTAPGLTSVVSAPFNIQ